MFMTRKMTQSPPLPFFLFGRASLSLPSLVSTRSSSAASRTSRPERPSFASPRSSAFCAPSRASENSRTARASRRRACSPRPPPPPRFAAPPSSPSRRRRRPLARACSGPTRPTRAWVNRSGASRPAPPRSRAELPVPPSARDRLVLAQAAYQPVVSSCARRADRRGVSCFLPLADSARCAARRLPAAARRQSRPWGSSSSSACSARRRTKRLFSGGSDDPARGPRDAAIGRGRPGEPSESASSESSRRVGVGEAAHTASFFEAGSRRRRRPNRRRPVGLGPSSFSPPRSRGPPTLLLPFSAFSAFASFRSAPRAPARASREQRIHVVRLVHHVLGSSRKYGRARLQVLRRERQTPLTWSAEYGGFGVISTSCVGNPPLARDVVEVLVRVDDVLEAQRRERPLRPARAVVGVVDHQIPRPLSDASAIFARKFTTFRVRLRGRLAVVVGVNLERVRYLTRGLPCVYSRRTIIGGVVIVVLVPSAFFFFVFFAEAVCAARRRRAAPLRAPFPFLGPRRRRGGATRRARAEWTSTRVCFRGPRARVCRPRRHPRRSKACRGGRGDRSSHRAAARFSSSDSSFSSEPLFRRPRPRRPS